ncbi:phosphatidate cytidylyltransferase, partial [bacterium]|nr:phosphatidate cytidylyltransferase [bacterium]
LGAKEYTQILQHKGFLPSFKIIMASSLLFALLAYFNRFDLVPLAFTVSTIMAFMWVLFRGKQPYIANVATTILGFVYCGWFPLHLLFLRDVGGEPIFNGLIKHSPDGMGAAYALMMFFSIILTDSMCYYSGLRYGKHKLSPVISPNKTIEGSIGGTISCVIFCLIFGHALQIEWYHSLVIGLLNAMFAQIGDLAESMIKRDAGVKDSSNILPGHGGFLDRTDSYILSIPVLYYYIYFFVENNFLDLIRGLF